MKFLILPATLWIACLGSAVNAQAPAETAVPAPVPAPAPAIALTEAQVNAVLNQLKELETQILQMRGSTLSTVLARLRAGMASDQTAMNLYLECDRLVNSDRKDVDKADARKRQEMVEKNMERRSKGAAQDDDGDFAFAVRLGLHYLVLTLEAHEAKEEEFKKMVPKLQEYIQALIAAAPKVKGRAQVYLGSALTDRNPVVDAFNLSRYLTRKEWNTRPLDIGGMYAQTLLPLAEVENKESLPALWDARITAEGAFRKGSMFEAEFALWTQNELPILRWERALYLYEKGPSKVTALADMLKLIKDNPAHADAPKWVQELRQLVNQSAPAPTSLNLEPAPGA